MKIGTRGSNLALTQSKTIAKIIENYLGKEPEIVVIKTQGDLVVDRPLRELEGKGFFTKELEVALLEDRIDLAVHSFKDMPSQAPDGLLIAAVSARADTADLLIINQSAFDPDYGYIPLKIEASVGTSAVRREAQLLAKRGDLIIKDLRGNVPTRLKKLVDGQYDAIMLASAGIQRLKINLSDFIVVRFDPTDFVPSPGQGALALQMKKDHSDFAAIKKAIHNQDSFLATNIERDVLNKFGAGCGLPLGAYAYKEDSLWQAVGFWGGENGVWAKVFSQDPLELADKLYQELSNG